MITNEIAQKVLGRFTRDTLSHISPREIKKEIDNFNLFHKTNITIDDFKNENWICFHAKDEQLDEIMRFMDVGYYTLTIKALRELR